jgi:hypothetical protein
MKYDTIREAAEAWVSEMNAISTDMIAKLWEYEPDEWMNVTPPCRGTRVYVYDSEEYGEVESCIEPGFYIVELDNGDKVECGEDDFELEDNLGLPMWGTMWSFGDGADDYWLTDMDGLQKMAECGFTIFYSEEFGYFFGIDGCGYSFFEEHWIPLYKARGLHWHKEEEAA